MLAPGATPFQDLFRPAMAPATQVGWSNVPPPVNASRPVVLCDLTTLPVMSPPRRTLWYSTTATRTPLPPSPLPVVQLASTARRAVAIDGLQAPSRPRLTTSSRLAMPVTAPAGRSTNTTGAEVLA